MYCRYCGKEIEFDSLYCRNCGKKQSGEDSLIKSMDKRKHFHTFSTLSKIEQNAILLYSLWILLWILFVIFHKFDEDYLFPAFLFAIVIPFAALCLWFVFFKDKQEAIKDRENKYIAPANSNNKQPITECIKNRQDDFEQQSPITSSQKTNSDINIINTELLLDFARVNGKMQVVKKKCNDEVVSYCIFTGNNGVIEVDFSPQLGYLTAEEIEQRKYSLCVITYKSGKYELATIGT